ncbi:MAG: hypothetical protein IKK43_00155 [Clostridia bacterium]|nr:hypothetical protein [Clostridia bacterium]
MVLVAFVVALVAFLISSAIWDRDEYFSAGAIKIISIIIMVVCAMIAVGAIIELSSAHNIDQKIELHTQENAAIEERISGLVNGYMFYEKETYQEFSGDAMTILTVYPELKSDTLVQEQIKLYNENYQKVLELKAQKIDVSRAKWVLYFGR